MIADSESIENGDIVENGMRNDSTAMMIHLAVAAMMIVYSHQKQIRATTLRVLMIMM